MTENNFSLLGRPSVAVPLLFVLTFAVRFSFFYTPTIDWDESTFILFGQHILNGGLPYVDFFDVKPPLLFYFYAGAIKVFGATIPAVRVAGALCVFVAASACYFLGRHMWGRMAGLFAGILCISGMSVGSGMATMSETVAMAPLMTWAYLVIAENRRSWTMFLAGACMGAAVLIRSNLAYACLFSAPGVLYILFEDKRGISRRALFYALGGVCVLLLTLYPFYARDGLGDLYRAVVRIPMEGMKGAVSTASMRRLVRTWNHNLDLLMVLSLCGLQLCFTQIKGRSSEFYKSLILIISFTVGIVLSFTGGRTVYTHYFIQIIPVLALLGGYLLYFFYKRCSGLKFFCYVFIVYILLLPSLPLSFSIQRFNRILYDRDSDYNIVVSAESNVVKYIKERLPKNERIWAMDKHIIYWLLSIEPPSKYSMHPSKVLMNDEISISSRHKTTSIDVIKNIFAKKPYFILRENQNWYIQEGTPEGDLINATMRRQYKQVAQFGNLGVFRIADK